MTQRFGISKINRSIVSWVPKKVYYFHCILPINYAGFSQWVIVFYKKIQFFSSSDLSIASTVVFTMPPSDSPDPDGSQATVNLAQYGSQNLLKVTIVDIPCNVVQVLSTAVTIPGTFSYFTNNLWKLKTFLLNIEIMTCFFKYKK